MSRIFVVLSTTSPSGDPFEGTFLATRARLSRTFVQTTRIRHKNTACASTDDIFSTNSCKFEKFVVPLQQISKLRSGFAKLELKD